MADASIEELTDALNAIDPAQLDRSEWFKVSCAAKAGGIDEQKWDAWCARDQGTNSKGEPRYDAENNHTQWLSIDPSKPGGASAETIFQMAYARGWSPAEHDSAFGWDDEVVLGDCKEPAWANRPPKQDGPAAGATTPEPLDLPPADVPDPLDLEPAQELSEWAKSLFEPGETVNIVCGNDHPSGKGWLVPYETLADNPEKILAQIRDTDHDGAMNWWVRVNPVRANLNQPATDADVTAYRNALLESDKIPIERQREKLAALNAPTAAVVESGGKSVHGLVRIGAKDLAEYHERVAKLYATADRAGFAPDRADRNPSRLTRLPSVARPTTGKRQRLLNVNTGCRSWDEWTGFVAGVEATRKAPQEVQEDETPAKAGYSWSKDEEYDFDAIVDTPYNGPEFLVGWSQPDREEPNGDTHGIVKRGGITLIVGPPGIGKTFFLLDMSLAVASGTPFMGIPCEEGSVLLIDGENDIEEIAPRVKALTRARAHTLFDTGDGSRQLPQDLESHLRKNLTVLTLSAFAKPMNEMEAELESWAKERAAETGRPIDRLFDMVVIDPVYPFEQGDENSASDVSQLFVAERKLRGLLGGAAFVDAHHPPKNPTLDPTGNPAGSSAFGRCVTDIVNIYRLDLDDFHKGLVADRFPRESKGGKKDLMAARFNHAKCREAEPLPDMNAVFTWPQFTPTMEGDGHDILADVPIRRYDNKQQNREKEQESREDRKRAMVERLHDELDRLCTEYEGRGEHLTIKQAHELVDWAAVGYNKGDDGVPKLVRFTDWLNNSSKHLEGLGFHGEHVKGTAGNVIVRDKAEDTEQ